MYAYSWRSFMVANLFVSISSGKNLVATNITNTSNATNMKTQYAFRFFSVKALTMPPTKAPTPNVRTLRA
jgi:hypothetical protein